MTDFEKRLFVALAVATAVMLFNIVAVTQGIADGLYARISDWLFSLAG